jgi:DNA transformation protein
VANSRDYVAHVLELMRPAGAATARAMFGGHGLYVDGLIVGIVVDDVLYLKTDERTRAQFAAGGGGPFRYATKRGAVQVSTYWQPPEDALEGAAALRGWLRLAVDAALRGRGAPRPRKAGRRKRG